MDFSQFLSNLISTLIGALIAFILGFIAFLIQNNFNKKNELKQQYEKDKSDRKFWVENLLIELEQLKNELNILDFTKEITFYINLPIIDILMSDVNKKLFNKEELNDLCSFHSRTIMFNKYIDFLMLKVNIDREKLKDKRDLIIKDCEKLIFDFTR
jgi:hypothetical protein